MSDINEEIKIRPDDFKKILVVDDVTYVLKTLVRTLNNEGYFTISATTGREALEKYEKYYPDLITVDQRLPDMTGAQLVKSIRQLKNGENARIIFISAIDDKETIKSILHLGVAEYLLKPFEKVKLLDAVKKVFEENPK